MVSGIELSACYVLNWMLISVYPTPCYSINKPSTSYHLEPLGLYASFIIHSKSL